MTRRLWTDQAILQAIRDWTDRHGKPPTSFDWRYAGFGHPSGSTVRLYFETFAEARERAGVSNEVRYGFERYWTRERIANAMLDWTFVHGRWPTKRQWNEPHGGPRVGGAPRPSANTVLKAFGSWQAAKVFAGYDNGGKEDKQTRRYFGRRTSLSWRCAGCGTDDPANTTVGCKTCSWRRKKRNQSTQLAKAA